MQDKEITKRDEFSKIPSSGRIVGLDPGTKRIGLAITDETQTLTRPLTVIERSSWKKLLLAVKEVLDEYDAKALIVGLPYNFDGSESPMTADARALARKFTLSLNVPVMLQDERASTYEARGRLWSQGKSLSETRHVDADAAAVILADFLDRRDSVLRNQ